MTDRGWQLLWGPLQPTPREGHWWHFGMLGHSPQFAASEREALEMLADDTRRDGAPAAAERFRDAARITYQSTSRFTRASGIPYRSVRTNHILRRA